jgi:hypothetical protein
MDQAYYLIMDQVWENGEAHKGLPKFRLGGIPWGLSVQILF